MDLEGIMLKWNKSDREERQILYDFIYMWNLKKKKNKKTNEQIWQNRNIVINTENKQVIARREELGGMSEISDGS